MAEEQPTLARVARQPFQTRTVLGSSDLNAGQASKYGGILVAAIGLVLIVACGRGTVEAPVADKIATPSPTAVLSPGRETDTHLSVSTRPLAAGEFNLPAAGAFGDPGFHEVLAATHDLPSDVGAAQGLKLVLKLWDAGRPEIDCSSEHPLSGCATVDWSDAEGRPDVPSGGVFDNSITFQSAAGKHRFFLSESGALNDEPDPFDPG